MDGAHGETSVTGLTAAGRSTCDMIRKRHGGGLEADWKEFSSVPRQVDRVE